MPTVLLLEVMQEISSFNPQPSEYADFNIQRGAQMLDQRGGNTAIGQAINVLEGAGAKLVPVYGAEAGSGGLLSAEGWNRLSSEFLSAAQAAMADADAILVSLHGAMGAEGQLDPEGYLLSHLREMAGPDMPIVASFDLHGILTARMLEALDAFAVYKTYPHVDFGDTGARAAELLLKVLAGARPVTARVTIPVLVRGVELLTKSGCYGELIAECIRLERSGRALAASILIGNPFTDVPELCSQVVVTTDADADTARTEAQRLAQEFWDFRHLMQTRLVPVDRAIAQAEAFTGTVVFTDAADATSSGATGDSNEILKALRAAKTTKRVLAQIVDAPAAQAAFAAGVGASVELSLGGTRDPDRFSPFTVTARVRHLWDGKTHFETSGIPLDAGLTAVIEFDTVTLVVMSRSVNLLDRAMYLSSGLNPPSFDLIVVKSPRVEAHMYDDWVAKNFNVDAPGATSADLSSLGHSHCARPMYPLELETVFTSRCELYERSDCGAAVSPS